MAYVGDGSSLMTGHANRLLRLHDARTGRLVSTLRGPEGLVSLMVLAPDRLRLAVCSHDRTLRLFDVEERAQIFSVPGHRTRHTTSLAFFRDGTHLASVAQDNAVQLWDIEKRAAIAALWGQGDESFAGISLFGGGDHIAVALTDGRIRLWGPAG